jgi:hypothetical protein
MPTTLIFKGMADIVSAAGNTTFTSTVGHPSSRALSSSLRLSSVGKIIAAQLGEFDTESL